MKKCKQNKTKRKEKKNKTSSSKNQAQYILCIGAILYGTWGYVQSEINISLKHYPWNFRRQGPFPKPFHAWIKLQAIFFIVKNTQRKLHLSTGRNYHLTRRQLTRNKPVQWVFIISHWFLHGTWLLLYKTSQQSLPVLFQLSACQCCSEPVEGTKMIINILTSKRATAKFSHAQPSQNARNRCLQGTGASSRYLLFFQKKKKANKRFSH